MIEEDLVTLHEYRPGVFARRGDIVELDGHQWVFCDRLGSVTNEWLPVVFSKPGEKHVPTPPELKSFNCRGTGPARRGGPWDWGTGNVSGSQ